MLESLYHECVRCHSRQPAHRWTGGAMVRCSQCNSAQRVEFFPAMARPDAPVQAGRTLLAGDEASCFYHPHKQAVIACEECGRFLCALCEVELSGRRLCPGCIKAGQSKRKIKNLENRCVLYDDLALSLALLPLLFFYLTLLTAPVALFLALRHWNSPRGILPRTRIRYVLAILFSGAQLAGWAIFFYILFWRD